LVLSVGIPVSLVALIAGIIFARKYAAKTYIDPNPQISAKELKVRSEHAPGAFKSSLPVIVPILLIVLRSSAKAIEGLNGTVVNFIAFIGEPFIALLIGVFLALMLPKKLEKEMLSTSGWIGKSLSSAASIILITGAGGIFGKVLQNSGIDDVMGETLVGLNLNIWLPFILAAAIKTAQGSSTVSLITTASIMAPLMEKLGFGDSLEKAMVVIAIGAGSAVVSHANDSFFWVVTQMSGMDTKMGYRMQTLGTFVIGTTAAITLFIVHLILN
jgi:GntP family gluconate:H+ symporter